MTYTLKERVFGFFGVAAKVNDTYPDVNGKGIWERYNEAMGEGYDDELSDLIDLFQENTLIPRSMLSKLIPTYEKMVGDPVRVLDTIQMRRRVLKFIHSIYNIKGTALSYEVMLKMLGFDTVVVNEYTIVGGFDSDVTLDDPDRRFDESANKVCSYYSIELTGVIAMDPPVFDAIFRIIDFLEPINAHLRKVIYNGDDITPDERIFDFSYDFSYE